MLLGNLTAWFLANVNMNSCSRSLYVVVNSSVCHLSIVYVRHAQAIKISSNFSTLFGTYWLTIDTQAIQFYGDRPRRIPRLGGGGWRGRGLKAGEVTEYSDFGPIDSYISETVQDKFVSL